MVFRNGLVYGLLLNTVSVFGDSSRAWSALGAPTLDVEATTLPSSCANLEDGQHYLKLMEGDDYPLILATCSNGYTLIDYSSDSDWAQYFSSFLKWHYAIGGPSQSDHYNWAEWYAPDDASTNYLISPSCDACEESAQEGMLNTQGYQSGYYMNANLFGCFVYPRGMPDCDFNINTYECHACYTDNFNTMYSTDWDAEDMTDFGACMTWIRGAYDEVDRSFDECTDQTDNGYKPTIGLKGEFCVCTKPETTQDVAVTEEQIVAKKESMVAQAALIDANEQEEARLSAKSAEDEVFYMYQKDFEKGTYRIQEPGTYNIMEDIEFHFNPGTADSPNAQGAWFPDENSEDYPGYGGRDTYFMGWFAGITIECNDVVLNLNGHELTQSKEFFYQQGFFSTIEVESQPFIPGQGVGFFGSDPIFPENVVIKNGNIGRTSHHCIHGNYNKNLLIEDISCYDFSTHGIQLNGFDGVTLRNVDIGPSNTEQFLASEYTHYRFLLDRLRKIADNNPTGTIQFDGRDPVTMADIAEELELKMNLAYKYVMYNEEYVEGDELYEDFVDAVSIFVSETGLGYGASQYGLFLSYPGANVLSYHLNSQSSKDATLENVKIHDLHHKTKEYIGIRTTLRLFVNSFNAPLHAKYLLGDDAWSKIVTDGNNAHFGPESKYVGNILTDATIAMTELNDDWAMNQIIFLKTDELGAWARGEVDGLLGGDGVTYLCSVDGMIHSVKGVFGLRIDGVDDVSIDGLDIYNIQEDSPMGYGMCGHCSQCAFESRSPYSVRYAGNVAQAMSIDYASPVTMKDVTVDNVRSLTGKVNGIAVWPGVELEFQGKIQVSNVMAGMEIDVDSLKSWETPDAYPDVCAIRVYDETAYDENDSDNDITTVTYEDDVEIIAQCISGNSGCWGSNEYTQHGRTYSCDGTSDMGVLEGVVNKKERGKFQAHQANVEGSGFVGLVKGNSGLSFAVLAIIVAAAVYGMIWIYKNKSSKTVTRASGEQTPLMI